MRVYVNGEAVEIEAECSLSKLLAELDVDPRVVAIELCGDVVPRAEFSVTMVRSGDRVEVVRFVQGG